MNELHENLRKEFHDKQYRTIYADESLNTYIATQIKALREQNGWTQKRLAEEADMVQPRIAVMEDINYSSWSLNTLRRLAAAFDLRLSVRFETFSSLIRELDGFKRESLERAAFKDDQWFFEASGSLPEQRKQNSEPLSTAVPFFTLCGMQLKLNFSEVPVRKSNLILMPNREERYVESGTTAARYSQV